MPSPGDQHRATAVAANPFEERPIRLQEYTAREIATLQSRLDKQLGPEYISSRQGPGGSKVHYLAAEKVINLANEVFGFNGWSSQIQNVQIDFVDESQSTGKITLGLSIIVRVTLRDGTFHEDIGYGAIENCKGKAAAFEKAKKEAATDALKRALRNFGNVLGNCLYDKDYLSKITKMKVQPTKWDAENLHRHSDFVPVKKEAPAEQDSTDASAIQTADFEDDFGGDLFEEMDARPGSPSHVSIPQNYPQAHTSIAGRASGGSTTQGQGQYRPANANPNASNATATNMGPPIANVMNNRTGSGSMAPQKRGLENEIPGHSMQSVQNTSLPQDLLANDMPEPPVGFITSRAAEMLNSDQPPDKNVVSALPRFNPNTDSPTLRRTSGIDHGRSAPILRATLATGPTPGNNVPQTMASSGSITPNRPPSVNYVNPADNPRRQIGAPVTSISPHSNRGAYKPPTMSIKRQSNGAHDGSDSPARQPLSDVSNTLRSADGVDAKRQRVAET